MRLRRRFPVVATAAVLLTLAACGGEDEAAPYLPGAGDTCLVITGETALVGPFSDADVAAESAPDTVICAISLREDDADPDGDYYVVRLDIGTRRSDMWVEVAGETPAVDGLFLANVGQRCTNPTYVDQRVQWELEQGRSLCGFETKVGDGETQRFVVTVGQLANDGVKLFTQQLVVEPVGVAD